MKNDLISRQAAIDTLEKGKDKTAKGEVGMFYNEIIQNDIKKLKKLPSAQPDNQVNLCDSCKYSYPDCPSEADDVIFGNGKGNDNICACNKYLPTAQPEIVRCKGCKQYDSHGHRCKHWNHRVSPTDWCSYAERRTYEH